MSDVSKTADWFRLMFLTLRGLAFVLAVAWFFAPAVETRFFPVVSPINDIAHVEVEGGTLLAADADKFRVDCDWRETKWFLGLRDNPDSVPIPRMEHLDAPQIRIGSKLHWDAIFIPLPWDVIATNTHANARHACFKPRAWWPDWANYWSTSAFFDGSIEGGSKDETN